MVEERDSCRACVKPRDSRQHRLSRGESPCRTGTFTPAQKRQRHFVFPYRRIYRMSNRHGLNEIKQAGLPSALPQAQLDWRWIERYRQLCAYDSYWWLSWAGPFTEEEQKTWNHLFTHPLDEATKAQLSKLMNVARERELAAAIAEQREPHLHYPAIQIEDIHSRIVAQHALQEEIKRLEPNPIVR